MTPAARVAAAIEVLTAWQEGTAGLDRVLTDWGRRNRFAGAKDRRAIADLAYDTVRRMRSAAWAAGLPETGAPRSLVAGALRLAGTDPATRFTGEGHAPPSLAPQEIAPARDPAAAPRAVRLDLPDWLMTPGRLGDLPDAALAPLARRAPLHLRVNALRTKPDDARAALAREDVTAVPGPLSPLCLTVTEGARRLAHTRAYLDGLVEIQDAASQAVADLAAARAGETVLDLCAGGGGKTLALAAAMAGRGWLVATDAAAARLAQLGPRADRAGARIETRAPGADLPRGCDLVLVDAPCSGTGAFARNPDAKWRLSEADLARLRATQDALLDRAVAHLGPGGRLVYATCSLLPEENAARIEALAQRRPELVPGPRRQWTPDEGGDGFFAAVLVNPC